MAKPAENELCFLPTIYEIIRSIEKDCHDVNQKMNDLKNRLQRAREYVEKLPGVQYTKDDQMKHTEVLRKQLITKSELLQKYKSSNNFNLSH